MIIPPEQSKAVDDLTTMSAAAEDAVRGIVEKMGTSDGLTSIVLISMSILEFSFLYTIVSLESFHSRYFAP